MENRKLISECLSKIYDRYNRLKEIVDNTPDESLNDILDNHFWEYTTNIEANFSFLEMIVSRRILEDESSEESKFDMTNEELDEYFQENWDSVINLCA